MDSGADYAVALLNSVLGDGGSASLQRTNENPGFGSASERPLGFALRGQRDARERQLKKVRRFRSSISRTTSTGSRRPKRDASTVSRAWSIGRPAATLTTASAPDERRADALLRCGIHALHGAMA
ncbi:hypothetical protein [Lysobacter gummosus]|uniref:hypothetical protein n=1 Tax=Lysobacter gummosus TaxID=262324 RepID=UPI00363CDCFB